MHISLLGSNVPEDDELHRASEDVGNTAVHLRMTTQHTLAIYGVLIP